MNQSVRFIDCKAGGMVPDDMVQRWLKDRIPLIRSIAEFDHSCRNCSLGFEFWTSGKLSPEARAMVRVETQKIRKFKLTVLEGEDVESAVKKTNDSALKRTYAEHFLGHPLARIERVAKIPKRRLPIPPNSTLIKRDEERIDAFDCDDTDEADVANGQ